VIVEGKNGHKPLEAYGLEHPIVVLGGSKSKQQPHIYYVAGQVVSKVLSKIFTSSLKEY